MKFKSVITAFIAVFFLGGVLEIDQASALEAKRTILSTTFPIHQIVRRVIEGRNGITAQIMLPSQLGCPHDYALTPQDLQKLARTDILVINGLGLEEFLDDALKKANPKMMVINSAAGITETLSYSDAHDEKGDSGETVLHHEKGEHPGEGDHPKEGHSHQGVNPHLFASPRMSAKLSMTIAAGLSKADPEGAEIYLKNAQAYAEAMNRLGDEMVDLGSRLNNNRIVQPHGVFDYLARDIGLKIVATMQADGQEPSAAEMIRLVKVIREKSVGVIVTEPQYPEKVGKAISKETNIPVVTLDPVASGPENAPLIYYETMMRQNMQILRSTLQVR